MMDLKERILTGWTLTRALYVALGLYVVINSSMNRQWMGVVLGVYFASMGVFSFGCAAGNCYPAPRQPVSKNDIQEVEFEEVKEKGISKS